MGTVVLFEDPGYRRLLPLVHFRPVYDLRCGIRTLAQKIRKFYHGEEFVLFCREELSDVVKSQNAGTAVNVPPSTPCLLINGRTIFTKTLFSKIPSEGPEEVFLSGNEIVAARIDAGRLRKHMEGRAVLPEPSWFVDFPKSDVEARVVVYPWDLVRFNGEEIKADFKALVGRGRIEGRVYQGAVLVQKKDIFVGKGAKVKPGVVLDAENGPIFIGRDAVVLPNAVIEGPAFVGEGSWIKIGAKIYENTSIGEMCKVGGEVEASIVHSHSNKQHDGFLGHSYLGQWVNIGADTNNSDLKNNYGSVKVVIDNETVDSGSMFVGLTMGDHSKSGINTMFNTGTVVGVGCNVFGSDFPPKTIPSFSWGGTASLVTYDVDKCIEVARRVMARRKVEMTGADEALFRRIFEATAPERGRWGVKPAGKAES